MGKTYKREAACVMLAFLAGLCVYGLWSGDNAALEWAKLLTAPIFLFAGGAFGLDVVAKQWPKKSGQAGDFG